MGLFDIAQSGVSDPYLLGMFNAANEAMPQSSSLASTVGAIPRPQPFNMQRMIDSAAVRSAIYAGRREMDVMPRAARQPRAGMFRQGNQDVGSEPTFNPALIDPNILNPIMSQLGVRMPTQQEINPFLFFNHQNPDGSPTWAANHPRFAHAIEGGMLGAMTPGGDTIGENISNVARTVMGIPGQYAAHIRNQYMEPFAAAQAMGPLIKDQAELAMLPLRQRLLQAQTEDAEAQVQQRKNPPKEGTFVPGSTDGGIPQWFFANQATGTMTPATTSQRTAGPPNAQGVFPSIQTPVAVEGKNGAMGEDLTPGRVLGMQMSANPSVRATGNAAARLIDSRDADKEATAIDKANRIAAYRSQMQGYQTAVADAEGAVKSFTDGADKLKTSQKGDLMSQYGVESWAEAKAAHLKALQAKVDSARQDQLNFTRQSRFRAETTNPVNDTQRSMEITLPSGAKIKF